MILFWLRALQNPRSRFLWLIYVRENHASGFDAGDASRAEANHHRYIIPLMTQPADANAI